MAGDNYKNLMTEIIRKQMDVLGQEMAIGKARNVMGLKIKDDGEVAGIVGSPEEILQDLVQVYISLSGEIVKNILSPVFAKYPDIKLNLK
ncbi:MAG: hypothetical protein A3K06_01975 [Candidatus Doudnabacteria bacterium RIFCSPHIGHO2_01_52_17]|uniref:Uncharacterized protein n=1 Tax=Candidatus Doudnabacteria bacterium RIFCSPHIGHO2_01_52_17 TaxID=1817820 RepID=A0A1F5NAU2_9BACT|nr:MAG: hypothetical protein UY73_C0012G0003 [Parcubacteria group bacterium GW2011_GWA2_52_8]OGE74703.1 MAG: hypothetical protein A3K06_01975 [Candidatus Doudnabacteria bacterium RIFCSPHIGHO2_01_52_17]